MGGRTSWGRFRLCGVGSDYSYPVERVAMIYGSPCPSKVVPPYLDRVQAIGQIHKLWRDKVIFSTRRHSRELRSTPTWRLTAHSIDSHLVN
ncbi:unnamed protein product [Penicillium camemberti]|uniref:Str. FM013 n=1 Tax=Penicillium camemberti (strain FM 013) TaxID=1429867 RepID=A0A0G4P1N4_PENC3|nr:unnamed protein product [Penicillium camemberti]